MKQFLKKKSELLETLAANRSDREPHRRSHIQRHDGPQTIQSYVATKDVSCYLCDPSHSLYRCDKFRALSVQEKTDKVRLYKLCFNCLAPNHDSSSCQKRKCFLCNGNHNSLLHKPKTEKVRTSDRKGDGEHGLTIMEQNPTSSNVDTSQPSTTAVNCAQLTCKIAQVFLSTAQIIAMIRKVILSSTYIIRFRISVQFNN